VKLGEKTIEEIKGQVEGLTRAWLLNINDAFGKFGGEKFPINYKTLLDIGNNGSIKVKTEIKFRPEPDISDTASGNVDENQMGLFDKSDDKIIISLPDFMPLPTRPGAWSRGHGRWC